MVLFTLCIFLVLCVVLVSGNRSFTLKTRQAQENFRQRHFCPNPNYVEFNAEGCADSSTSRACRYTLNKKFTPKPQLCKTLNTQAYSRYYYRNSQYFNLITDTFYYLGVKKTPPRRKARFLTLLGTVIRYSCHILEIEGIETKGCLQMTPIGEYLIRAIRQGTIEKYRIHALLKQVQGVAEKYKGQHRTINIWQKKMWELIKVAKEFQAYT